MFNYVCHTIYYMEFLFGKIKSTKSDISWGIKKNINSLNSVIFFESGLSAKLDIRIASKKFIAEPIHQLKILSERCIL